MDRVPQIFLTDDSGRVRKSRVKSASTETETSCQYNRRRTSNAKECADSCLYTGSGRGSSPEVLRTKGGTTTQGRVRRRRGLRVWQRLLGFHVSIAWRGNVEGEHRILGR